MTRLTLRRTSTARGCVGPKTLPVPFKPEYHFIHEAVPEAPALPHGATSTLLLLLHAPPPPPIIMTLIDVLIDEMFSVKVPGFGNSAAEPAEPVYKRTLFNAT